MPVLDDKGFDLWADGYDRSVAQSDDTGTYPFAGYKDVLGVVYDTVRKNGGARLLDVGFGTGVLTRRLYGDGYAVTGVDFSEKMIEHARAAMPNAQLLRHDFTQGMPEVITAQRYDAIVSTYALHHLPDAEKVSLLRDLYRLLAPGGVLCVGDVSFKTQDAMDALRADCGDEWDADEYYMVYEAARTQIAVPSAYRQVSVCGGVLTLRRPRMVLFDFGGTLAEESPFDSLAAHRALHGHVTENRDGITAEEADRVIQALFESLDDIRITRHAEIHEHPFQRFCNEYLGLTYDLSMVEQELTLWNAACSIMPTEGIADLLASLAGQGIRTGVISNIMYSGEALAATIKQILPGHAFEFIIATSEYIFRKPERLIFELALRKAGLGAKDVWYCGDNFVCDVEGAQEAGITPVWYTDNRHDLVTTVRSWRELTAWMR